MKKYLTKKNLWLSVAAVVSAVIFYFSLMGILYPATPEIQEAAVICAFSVTLPWIVYIIAKVRGDTNDLF